MNCCCRWAWPTAACSCRVRCQPRRERRRQFRCPLQRQFRHRHPRHRWRRPAHGRWRHLGLRPPSCHCGRWALWPTSAPCRRSPSPCGRRAIDHHRRRPAAPAALHRQRRANRRTPPYRHRAAARDGPTPRHGRGAGRRDHGRRAGSVHARPPRRGGPVPRRQHGRLARWCACFRPTGPRPRAVSPSPSTLTAKALTTARSMPFWSSTWACSAACRRSRHGGQTPVTRPGPACMSPTRPDWT